MNTIAKYTRTTYEINKSTFITTLKPVQNVNEAKAFFEEIKKEFSDATHNITVYIIGKTGEAGHYSDDGEPSGTAGLPVLEVFRKNDITNFACVVTRYFGGIKLGAGGLVRAYSSCASLALKEKHPKLWPLLNILGICYLPTLVVFLGLMPIFAYFSTFATATSINILGFILSAVIGLGGVIIEGVADGQMLKFKKDPNNVEKINQTGLWKNSRHPNYFGEIAFWISLFLFSMTISNRWVLLFCPLIVFLLFAFISIPMMEKRQLANKKGYDEYKKKTNLLLPIWPPQEKTNK